MRVPEEPVCIDLIRQNPVFTFLHLKSPVHVHRLCTVLLLLSIIPAVARVLAVVGGHAVAVILADACSIVQFNSNKM
jgi:hypothetical protein